MQVYVAASVGIIFHNYDRFKNVFISSRPMCLPVATSYSDAFLFKSDKIESLWGVILDKGCRIHTGPRPLRAKPELKLCLFKCHIVQWVHFSNRMWLLCS